MNESDHELLQALKNTAAEHGYSPDAFLAMASAAVKWNATAVIPNFGPYPTAIDEVEIDSDTLALWPAWVADLVPPGSKWERLHWPDGSITIRLVNHRSLVLAAHHFSKKDEPGS